jgi:hypothetical protein
MRRSQIGLIHLTARQSRRPAARGDGVTTAIDRIDGDALRLTLPPAGQAGCRLIGQVGDRWWDEQSGDYVVRSGDWLSQLDALEQEGE